MGGGRAPEAILPRRVRHLSWRGIECEGGSAKGAARVMCMPPIFQSNCLSLLSEPSMSVVTRRGGARTKVTQFFHDAPHPRGFCLYGTGGARRGMGGTMDGGIKNLCHLCHSCASMDAGARLHHAGGMAGRFLIIWDRVFLPALPPIYLSRPVLFITSLSGGRVPLLSGGSHVPFFRTPERRTYPAFLRRMRGWYTVVRHVPRAVRSRKRMCGLRRMPLYDSAARSMMGRAARRLSALFPTFFSSLFSLRVMSCRRQQRMGCPVKPQNPKKPEKCGWRGGAQGCIVALNKKLPCPRYRGQNVAGVRVPAYFCVERSGDLPHRSGDHGNRSGE